MRAQSKPALSPALVADSDSFLKLFDRAREIIADAETYDTDARRYIRNSLATSDPAELRRDVEMVEAGNECGDFSSDLDNLDDAPLTLADHLSAVMCDPSAPESITHALGKVLCRMADDAHAASKPGFIAVLLADADSSRYVEAGDE